MSKEENRKLIKCTLKHVNFQVKISLEFHFVTPLIESFLVPLLKNFTILCRNFSLKNVY